MKEIQIKNPGKNEFEIQKNEEIFFFLSDFDLTDKDFDIKIDLIGENSSVFFTGKIFSDKKVQKNLNLELNSHSKNQKIQIDLKGIADGESKISFDGGVQILENSKEAQVSVEQKIILFSEKSSGKTVPVLNAKTDQISSASHSASISPFEKEKIFYLETRGISESEGKELLKNGFLN